MKQRIPLADRVLPDYTKGEEIVNTVTHGLGAVFGMLALYLCCRRAAGLGWIATAAVSIYGISTVLLYTVSAVYHGLPPGMGKKVLQVVDHCTIYLLIAGTYTPLVLIPIRQHFPALGWGLFAAEWGLATLAIVLTAIDLEKYQRLSMGFYIGLGWAILPFLPQTVQSLGVEGFLLLLSGGISYTVGAVVFSLGVRMRWMHSVFHGFVLLGSLLQFLAIYGYGL